MFGPVQDNFKYLFPSSMMDYMSATRLFSFLLPAFCLLLAWPALAQSTPYQTSSTAFSFKETDFAAAVVMDAKTQKILFEYNADKLWVPASLTKLVGALTFIDRQPSWGAIVSIKASDEVGGGRLRVDEGATMSIQDLMYSSITGSANNAATAFGRLSGLGYTGFITAMNSKAKSLGCTRSLFNDSSGMDPTNLTTAREMLTIATAAFNRSEIQRPASTAKYTFTIRNTGEIKTISNTNQLLLDPKNGLYVTGGKTGYLDESLHNLVYRVRPAKDDNRELVIVVLGAPTRADMFAVSERLAKWTWSTFSWQEAPHVIDLKPPAVIQHASTIPNGTLIKKPGSPGVWYIWNNKKYVLLDGIFLDHYFPGASIQTLPEETVNALADARPYTFDDGELLKSPNSPVVYYVEKGRLRPISSEAAFLAMGWQWTQIITAPQWLLNTYSQGLAINTQNTSSVILVRR